MPYPRLEDPDTGNPLSWRANRDEAFKTLDLCDLMMKCPMCDAEVSPDEEVYPECDFDLLQWKEGG